MSACPVCHAAWPGPSAEGAICAVCPACYSVFDRDASGAWQAVPPAPSAARALPFDLGAPLDVAGQRYRVAGYAEWSYEVEHYRDMFDTCYRREFTLVSEADQSLAVLGSDAGVWWLARQVPAHTIDRSRFKPRFGHYYAARQAVGLLPQPFRWTSNYLPADQVAEPFGPGGAILPRAGTADAPMVWAGEFLPASALPESRWPTVAPTAPALAASHHAAPAPQPLRSSWTRRFAVAAIALGLFAAIGAVSFYRERRITPLVKRWVECPTPELKTRVPIPAGAGRVQLDAHLTSGAISYQLRFLNPSGTVGGDNVDAVLDMNPAHREPIHTVHPGAPELEMACSLPIPVEGRRQWLVEVRFFR